MLSQSDIPHTEYTAALKNLILPLRLLVENEVFRLTVWSNPANDPKRGADHICQLEKTMLDVSSEVSVQYFCTDDYRRVLGLVRRGGHGRLTPLSPFTLQSASITRQYRQKLDGLYEPIRRTYSMYQRRCTSLSVRSWTLASSVT